MFDLVISSSVWHWLTDRPRACGRMFQALRPGGIFPLALMLEDTFSELQAARAEAVPGKPPRPRLPQLQTVRNEMCAAGFDLLQCDEQIFPVQYDSVRAFFKSINRQGVTGGAASGTVPGLTRGELHRLERVYRHQFGDAAGRVQASYAVGFLMGQKAES
jgi:SAM-dependent methyltransferase